MTDLERVTLAMTKGSLVRRQEREWLDREVTHMIEL